MTAHADSWNDPARVALPYLCAAGSAAWRHQNWEQSLLREMLLGAADRYGDRVHISRELDRLIPEPGSPDPEALPSLGTLLAELAEGRSTTKRERLALLETARTLIGWRLAIIVDGKHQTRYGYAAQLSVALAEAQVFAGGSFDYYTQARQSYPRHSAFHRELEKVRKTSAFPK